MGAVTDLAAGFEPVKLDSAMMRHQGCVPSVGRPGAAEVYSGLSGTWGFLVFFCLQIHTEFINLTYNWWNRCPPSRRLEGGALLVDSGSVPGPRALQSRRVHRRSGWGCVVQGTGIGCARLLPSRWTVRLAHWSWTTYCIRSEDSERPPFRASFGIKMCSVGTTWPSSG